MGIRNFPVVSVQPGKKITIGTATFVTMPPMANGDLPKYVRISVSPGTAAGNIVFVSPSHTATAGSPTTGFPINADSNDGIILNVHGYSHISVARIGDSTSLMNFIPLSDF